MSEYDDSKTMRPPTPEELRTIKTKMEENGTW